MTTFKETLPQLKGIEDIERLELYLGDQSEPVWTIENKPGKQGSLKVYHHVACEFGGINSKAAEKALELFCEHVADAAANPGKHPNIDRLYEIIDKQEFLAAKTIRKSA